MKTTTFYAWVCVQEYKSEYGVYTVGQIYYFASVNQSETIFKPVMEGEHQKSVEVGE